MKTFDELIEAEASLQWSRRFGKATIADDFKAGAKFVSENPMMIESVKKLISAAKELEGVAYHSSTCETMTDFNDDECSCGREEAVEELELALKNLTKEQK